MDSSQAARMADSTGGAMRPPMRPRRNPRAIAIGALCICLGGLGAGFSYQQAVSSQQVVIVQHPLQRGQQVGSGDLGTVSISRVPGADLVPAAQAASLVGQEALTDLGPGALLPSGAIGQARLPADTSEVGLLLAAGRLPTGDLLVGTQVTLLAVPGPKDSPDANIPQTQVTAVVSSIPQAMPDGQSYLLDVTVSDAIAAKVAALAAADRLVLIRRST